MSTVTMISWLISSISTNEAVPLNLCLPSISPLLHHRVYLPISQAYRSVCVRVPKQNIWRRHLTVKIAFQLFKDLRICERDLFLKGI